MKTAEMARPNARPHNPDIATHSFKVGQLVRLKGGLGRPAQATDTYRIINTLPPSGGSPQYRIRSDREVHERVATEDSLMAVAF